MVEQWVKDVTEGVFGESKMEVGAVVKHPDGRDVLVTRGRLWGEHGWSNFWYWKEVLPDGAYGNEECGYGW